MIKYLNKLYLPKNYIACYKDVTDIGNLSSKSFTELVSMIKKKENLRNVGFVAITIYDMDKSVVGSKLDWRGEVKIRKLKDIYSRHVNPRTVLLSPSLKEIYAECFVYTEDPIYGIKYDVFFDYGILYGNKLYDDFTIAKTDFYKGYRIRKDQQSYPVNDYIDTKIFMSNYVYNLDDYITKEEIGDLYIGYFDVPECKIPSDNMDCLDICGYMLPSGSLIVDEKKNRGFL